MKATNWRTPLALYRQLNHLTPFNVDAAADSTNHLHDHWYGPGGEAEDALSVKAWRSPAFCNPPYDNLIPWLRKFDEQASRGSTIIALIPAAVGTRWWFEEVHNAETRPDVLFLIGRVPFLHPDRERASAPNHDSVVLVYQPGTYRRIGWWDWRSHAKVVNVSGMPSGFKVLNNGQGNEGQA
jgi:phage N-6-adenine-methyltransferase